MDRSFQFAAGRLLCGKIRDFLNAEKTKGREIRWHESGGILSRTFTIAGKAPDITYIESILRDFAARLERC